MPRIRPVDAPVTIELDGEPLQACAGEPAAATLLANDAVIFSRSPKYHRPRGAFCLTGACAHCLMRVDGVPNVPTCRVPAREGLRLERQNAIPDARLDVLRANDFVFRDWFNHHEFLAGVPVAEVVLQKVARQLAGLGTLPEREAPARTPARVEHHDVVIVGAGVAGRAAADTLRARGVKHLQLEREDGDEVVGLFSDAHVPFLAVIQQQQLALVFFKRLLLANGGHPAFPEFPNNDLPGVMAGRAVATLIQRDGVLPGRRVACVGDAEEASALASLVTEAGGEAVAVGAEVSRAHGLRRITGVTLKTGERLKCDVIAACAPSSPAFELARAAGADVQWNARTRCFEVKADASRRTSAPGVFVAGEVCGPMSTETAQAQGRAAAETIAAEIAS